MTHKCLIFLLIFIYLGLIDSHEADDHKCGHETLEILNQDPVFVEGLYETDSSGRVLQETYSNIRIHFDYTYYAQTDNWTEYYIKQLLIPAAADFFYSLLKVIPVTKNFTTTNTKICPVYSNTLLTPDNVKTGTGVGVLTDMFVVVIAYYSSTDGLRASAGPCMFDSVTNRPIVGMLNINTYNIYGSANMDTRFSTDLSTILHEFTHALVFAPPSYPLYIDPVTKVKLTGVTRTMIVNGNNVTYFTLPQVVQYVQDFFNCTTAVPLLENQGSAGTRGAHWERRIFMNEYMTGNALGKRRVSNLTLSLFEGSGWYKPTYSLAEELSWGRDRGCDFVFESCMINPTTARFPEYCANKGGTACSFDRRARGLCAGSALNYDVNLSPNYDYWANKSIVSDSFSDNCAYGVGYPNRLCEDSTLMATAKQFNGEFFGADSRCYYFGLGSLTTIVGTPRAFCLKTLCSMSGSDWSYTVYLGNATVNCIQEGPVTIPDGFGYTGQFPCENPKNYCRAQFQQFCTRGCWGNGKCVWTQGDISPHCECDYGFDGADCSITLYLDPLVPNVTNGSNVTNGTNNETSGSNVTNTTTNPPPNTNNNTNGDPNPPGNNVTNPTNSSNNNSTNNVPSYIIIDAFTSNAGNLSALNYQTPFEGSFVVKTNMNAYTCVVNILNATSRIISTYQSQTFSIQIGILRQASTYRIQINCRNGAVANTSTIVISTRAPPRISFTIQDLGGNNYLLISSLISANPVQYRFGYFLDRSLFNENSYPYFGTPTFVDSDFSNENALRIKIPDPLVAIPAYLIIIAKDSFGLVGYSMRTIDLTTDYLKILRFESQQSLSLINYQKGIRGSFVLNTSTTNYDCNWRVLDRVGSVLVSGKNIIVTIRPSILLPDSSYTLLVTCLFPRGEPQIYNTTLVTKAQARISISLDRYEGIALNTTFVATIVSNDNSLVYRFGYFRDASDLKTNIFPNFGYPLFLDSQFSSSKQISFTLPNFAENGTNVTIIAIAKDSDGLLSYNITSLTMYKYIPWNVISYINKKIEESSKNATKIIHTAYDAEALLSSNSSNATQGEINFVKKSLIETIVNTNMNQSDSTLFVHSSRIIKELFTQENQENRTISKLVLNYVKNQIDNQNMTVDKNDGETVLQVVSGSVSKIAKQSREISTLDDKDQLKTMLGLTNSITGQIVSSMSSGDNVTISTEAVKLVIAKTDTNSSQNFHSDNLIKDQTFKSVSLLLPPIFSATGIDGSMSVAFKIWNENVFISSTNKTISSYVASFTCYDENGNEIKLSGLNDKVQLNFTAPVTNMTSKIQEKCRYWNSTILDWDDYGCRLAYSYISNSNKTTVCECNHLTDFAIESLDVLDIIDGNARYQILALIVPFTLMMIIIALWGACARDSEPVQSPAKWAYSFNESQESIIEGQTVKKIAPKVVRFEDRKKESPSTCSNFFNSHNFFGICLYDDMEFTRPARAFLYLLRWYTITLISTAYFYNQWIDAFDYKYAAICLTFGILAALPIEFMLRSLLRNPNTILTALNAKSQKSFRNFGGYFIAIMFFVITLGGTLQLVSRTSSSVDNALVKCLALEMAFDLTLVHILKFILGKLTSALFNNGLTKTVLLFLCGQNLKTRRLK